ncbi:DNA-binding protein [bacterium]|nr:DNA-binding protein [bacterium]MBU1995306.1 DNA-binding protein [bacterium]
MLKMSIADAAEYFEVSKEAIHNRIRRGSLESVVENGLKLVRIDDTAQSKSVSNSIKTPSNKKTLTHWDEKYYQYLEEQNTKLQDKILNLENETRALREQKEQMLIQERIRIEQIYKDKDEQLKNILNAISSNFLLNTSQELASKKEEHLEAEIEIEDITDKRGELISLKKYLKHSNYSSNKKEKIKAVFKRRAKKDHRIILVGNKYYMDRIKYDYSDMF